MCAEHSTNPEIGCARGVSAATVAERLVNWALGRGYDYERWSNGHSFLSPSSLQDLPAKGHGRVNWLGPEVMNGLGVAGSPSGYMSGGGGAARG